MNIKVPSVPVLFQTAAVAVWSLAVFGSLLTTHIGADASHFGSFLLGAALWGAGSVWPSWFPPKPPTP